MPRDNPPDRRLCDSPDKRPHPGAEPFRNKKNPLLLPFLRMSRVPNIRPALLCKNFPPVWRSDHDAPRILVRELTKSGRISMPSKVCSSKRVYYVVGLVKYPVLLRRLDPVMFRAKASPGTIRDKLLKIATMVRVSVRRVLLRWSGSFRYQEEIALCCRQLGMASGQEATRRGSQNCGAKPSQGARRHRVRPVLSMSQIAPQGRVRGEFQSK